MKYLLLFLLLLISACRSMDPAGPVVDANAVMTFLQSDLMPEKLLFPEFLLMEDFELNQHGRIPGSSMIGGDMQTNLKLTEVRGRFGDALSSNGWKIDRVEVGGGSFRMLASKAGEEVEVRAVQETGAAQVFILYTPPVDGANSEKQSVSQEEKQS